MGAVFGMFAAFYYWIGKMTGFQYPENLGIVHFWTTFIGVNITFFPQHFLGLAGMPRRIPDYPDAYAGYNYISSFGSYVSVFAILIFFVVLLLLSKFSLINNYLKSVSFFYSEFLINYWRCRCLLRY